MIVSFALLLHLILTADFRNWLNEQQSVCLSGVSLLGFPYLYNDCESKFAFCIANWLLLLCFSIMFTYDSSVHFQYKASVYSGLRGGVQSVALKNVHLLVYIDISVYFCITEKQRYENKEANE